MARHSAGPAARAGNFPRLRLIWTPRPSENRMNIKHISDTARWMAYIRAVESERSDALFRDPYARQLAGTFGEAVARDLGSVEMIAASIAVRTAVLDRLIVDMVARLEVDLILNIGSGLDTRPWRLNLPAELQWLDADLPALLDHKAAV